MVDATRRWDWKEEYDITHPEGWAAGPDGTGAAGARRLGALDPDEPVVHVSWFEADAFARAHGARLPTEAEWEKAATWDQESRRPPSVGRRAADRPGESRPWPASARARGGLSDGAAPCGALGMLGDVWEWTATDVRRLPRLRRPPVPRVLRGLLRPRYRVLRGGSWATRARVATPTFRNWDLPQRRQIFSGMRLAWDA